MVTCILGLGTGFPAKTVGDVDIPTQAATAIAMIHRPNRMLSSFESEPHAVAKTPGACG
jgi:hypothetical protein